jgi:release factor glutamine methyltransferase
MQPSISQVLSSAGTQLSDAGISSSQLDAELLLAFALRSNRVWLHAHSDEIVPADVLTKFEALLQQRADRTPLVHLTGSREFYGLQLQVTPDVLTPRAETEVMVDLAIRNTPPRGHLIDIGTGSGAIAIAIAKHRPDITITATDISDKELTVAKRNAKANDAQIDFIKSDLWENISGEFDAIVTNLPYLQISAELMPEVKHEPAVALYGGEDGLELYRRFLRKLPNHLKSGGLLFTECDPWQQSALIKAANGVSLTPFAEDYFILGFKKS